MVQVGIYHGDPKETYQVLQDQLPQGSQKMPQEEKLDRNALMGLKRKFNKARIGKPMIK